MSPILRALTPLALAGLLTHCATSLGAGGAAGDAVTLRFAWPAGFSFQVDSSTTTSENKQPPEQSAQSLLVRLEEQGGERKLITEQVMSPEEKEALEKLGLMSMPVIVVGPKGELRRIEGIESRVEQMARQAEDQGLPKEQQTELSELMREALEQATRTWWEALVGKWSGLSLKPGEVVERRSQTTVPRLGSSADTVERVSLKERVACTEGAAEQRCVRVVLESSLDPKGLEQAQAGALKRLTSLMKASMGRRDEAIPEMKVTQLRIDSTVEFIAEPDTLVPHRLRTVRSSLLVLQFPDGASNNIELQSEQLERFTPQAR
ncbi:hypothetical protein [Hyalangium gracile]|uniref:hypothetical protein n=1 Tax=Hyalangium gracile TaxID=394092 RepID=UPI001CC9E893|nr:hypothetical protein [Hyalangium gracile]